MMERHCEIGVVIRQRMLDGKWSDRAWLPYAVLPAVPAAAPGTVLGSAGADTLLYAGVITLDFEPAAAVHYRHNLASGRPSLWISLSAAGALVGATADPYEGEALTEAIDSVVEAVPMPAAIQAKLEAFIAAFSVEQPFFKRERDRFDPQARGRRTRGRVA